MTPTEMDIYFPPLPHNLKPLVIFYDDTQHPSTTVAIAENETTVFRFEWDGASVSWHRGLAFIRATQPPTT